MDECLYVVKWFVLETGYSGEGKPISKANAQYAADKANSEYEGIVHWIEPVYRPRSDD